VSARAGRGELDGHATDSPPTDEQRPRQEALSSECLAAEPILRRRRAASLRCEPLADGRRDPWRYTPPTSPGRLEASRAAWAHLAFLGLLDSDGYVEGILRDLGRAS